MDSPISPDSEFESGVVKIQCNQTDTMTDAEGIACANLRMSSVSAASGRNTTSCNGTFNGDDHKAEEAKTCETCSSILVFC